MSKPEQIADIHFRVSASIRKELDKKFPRMGDIAKLYRALTKLYLEGRIDPKMVEDTAGFI